MMAKTTVMLVDDHAVVRMGFRLLIETAGDLQVVAEAESGEAACRQYPEIRPDVVVMDLAMAGIGGTEAVRRIVARDRHARILALSAFDDTSHPKQALAAGARGYLSKRAAPEALIEALRAIAAGQMVIDPAIAQRLALQGVGGAASPVERLSKREFEIFLQLAQGLSVQRIAEVFHLSPSTVGTHLYHIKQKLDAGTQAELALIAVRHGLIEV